MTGADFLKLRRKRWLVLLSLFLTLGIIAIVYLVTVIQHASDPSKHGPAGGVSNFSDGLRVLSLFFGPLAAILIGIEAGAGDTATGVFRDLVVTGRSRLALFASRVPAALMLCWTVVLSGFILLLVASIVFASGLPTPGTALIFNSLRIRAPCDGRAMRCFGRVRVADDLPGGRDSHADRVADRCQPAPLEHRLAGQRPQADSQSGDRPLQSRQRRRQAWFDRHDVDRDGVDRRDRLAGDLSHARRLAHADMDA